MSKIQDQAYTEACQEIERLKWLNIEERKTIEELNLLVERLCEALGYYNFDHLQDDLIRQAQR